MLTLNRKPISRKTVNGKTARNVLPPVPVKNALLSTESALLAFLAIVLTFVWRLLRQNTVVRGLQRQNRRVAELEEMKSTYLRLASHELRTPIGVARGYVDLARSGELGSVPEPVRAALAQVQESLADVDSILLEMVEMARMQEGRRLLQLEPFDIRQPVQEALLKIAPLATRHRLVVDLPKEPVLVEGDPGRVRVAVRNLLENAVKYSPNGGEVRCTVDEDKGQVKVRVSDEGIGIAQSQLKRLFQRFERVSQPSGGSIPGTGLGLHLAREIARAHDGDLQVTSRPGEGSTFALVLPAGKRHA